MLQSIVPLSSEKLSQHEIAAKLKVSKVTEHEYAGEMLMKPNYFHPE